MRMLKGLGFFLLLMVGALFAFLNRQTVSINYYMGIQEMPLAILLMLTFSTGILIGYLISSFRILLLNWENWRLRKRSSQLPTLSFPKVFKEEA